MKKRAWTSSVKLAAAALAATALLGRAQASVLDWQKVALEEKLHDRLARAIAVTVPENQFVVTVAIQLKPQPQPSAATPESKTDAQKADKKAGRKTGPGIPKSSGIPLGKLDMDAPLYVDPSEALKTSSQDSTDVSAATVGETALQAPSLFDQIQDAKVTIYLDKSIAATRDELVRRVAETVMAGVGQVPASVDVERSDLVTPPKAKSTIELASEFKTPISIIGASVLFCLFFALIGLMAFLVYGRFETRRLSILESKDAREQAQMERQEALARQAATAISIGSDGPGVQGGKGESNAAEAAAISVENGFDRFRKLVATSPERASAVVRNLIRSSRRQASGALAMLPQAMTSEDLSKIFGFLTLDDRKEWRRQIRVGSGDSSDVIQAFVSSQIVETLLALQPRMDAASKQMLDGIRMSEALEIAMEFPELGALLINALPPSQSARIFAMMPSDRANDVTASSLRMSEEEMRRLMPQLAGELERVRARTQQLPFLDRAVDLLRDADPVKESAILNAVAEAGDYYALDSMVRQQFPAELIPKLPPNVIRSCFESLSLEKRAELALALDGELLDAILGAVGKPGSKSRDLLEIEVERLRNDEIRGRAAEGNKVVLWREFVEISRSAIRNNESSRLVAESLITEWLSVKSGGAYAARAAA